jgi:hypothetical protein
MEIAQAQKNIEVASSISLSWTDNPAIHRLLDIVVSIMAEEYIQIARQNPAIFSSNGGKR